MKAHNDKNTSQAPLGLHQLDQVVLSRPAQEKLDLAAKRAAGTAVWRQRKILEARDVLALSEIAPPGRLEVQQLDLAESLRIRVQMQVTVPCLDRHGRFVVGNRATLGIVYRQEALLQRQRGYYYVSILAPLGVWLACVGPGLEQPLCLGAWLPAGIRVRELLLMSYGALTMTNILVDPADPARLMNPPAGLWWQQNLHRRPLCDEPFLGSERSAGGKAS